MSSQGFREGEMLSPTQDMVQPDLSMSWGSDSVSFRASRFGGSVPLLKEMSMDNEVPPPGKPAFHLLTVPQRHILCLFGDQYSTEMLHTWHNSLIPQHPGPAATPSHEEVITGLSLIPVMLGHSQLTWNSATYSEECQYAFVKTNMIHLLGKFVIC